MHFKSYESIWRMLRKQLKWKTYYESHLAQVLLISANKESRLAAWNYWLTFTDDWFQRVHIVRHEMVCFTTITKQTDRQVLLPWKPQWNCRMREGLFCRSDGLVENGRLEVTSRDVVREIRQFWGMTGAGAEWHRLAFRDGFNHQASVLVPTRRSQLSRDLVCGRVISQNTEQHALINNFICLFLTSPSGSSHDLYM